ncbi:LPS export ABC transporter permease LptF [Dokdonella sp.]|uniref:LPS export ABC transporter permease LptF n=1 Tax=Dokdonella sp. TaxID=2291710 RepID=UPI0031BEEE3E|nr:LPS export ABC transporter permease LptF [Dokdonella sp.]
MKLPILSQSPRARRVLAALRPGIADRYLLREVVASFLAASTVLMVVLVGGTLADLLSKVVRGRVPADLLFTLVGLRMVGSLAILFPLAALLGVLLAYGRLWRDSEMAVLQSSGLGLRGQARPLVLFGLGVAAVLALVSFWLGPAADRQAQRLLQEASRSLVVAGLEPGRFVSLPGRDGVIHVGAMSADGTHFQRMFIETERNDRQGDPVRIDVITAARGFLYHDADGVGRYMALEDGFRVEGKLGENDYRLMRFARNDFRLPDSVANDSDEVLKRAAPTHILLDNRDDPVLLAELHWRLAAPLSTLVLVLLAWPLSRSNSREPRYARLLLALLAWLIYFNFLVLARTWLAQGQLSPLLGFWWIHAVTAALALWLVWHGQRLPRPRAARTT